MKRPNTALHLRREYVPFNSDLHDAGGRISAAVRTVSSVVACSTASPVFCAQAQTLATIGRDYLVEAVVYTTLRPPNWDVYLFDEPGDWVAIHILDIEVAPYGFVNNGGPFRGHLRSVVSIRDGLIHFPPDFVVPVKPMVGVVQLEPVQRHPSPWNHGGNLDYTSIGPGSIVYIRSQRYGGHLTVDDVNARQGDGELTGTAVEIDSAVTKDLRRTGGGSSR